MDCLAIDLDEFLNGGSNLVLEYISSNNNVVETNQVDLNLTNEPNPDQSVSEFLNDELNLISNYISNNNDVTEATQVDQTLLTEPSTSVLDHAVETHSIHPMYERQSTSEDTNLENFCPCTANECNQKLVIIREMFRRASERKNYRIRHQKKAFMLYESRYKLERPREEPTMTTPLQLPFTMWATQNVLKKLNARPCNNLQYESTYVIRDDFKDDNYETNCNCNIHECKRKLEVLQQCHENTMKRKNYQLYKVEMMFRQFQ